MMQYILYRQKRQVRSGLGRQSQAGSLGLPLMATWSRIISEKVNSNRNCQENTHHVEAKT